MAFNNYPYTNFHELNLDYFINRFKEIFEEWENLYNQMETWKTETEQDISEWENNVIAELESWKNDFEIEYDEKIAIIQGYVASASASAQTATTKASEAQTSANSASNSAQNASIAEQQAQSYSQSAGTRASEARVSAESASASATSANEAKVWIQNHLLNFKSVLDTPCLPFTQYYLGVQTALNITLPTNAEMGDIVVIVWYNGSTPSTFNITNTNIMGFSYTPSAYTRSEINCLFDGTNWNIVFIETPTV